MEYVWLTPLYILAVYRLTHLLVTDDLPFHIGERWRAFLVRHMEKPIIGTIAEIFDCKYCMGIWATLLVVLLPMPLVFFLAVAGGQYLLETVLDR